MSKTFPTTMVRGFAEAQSRAAAPAVRPALAALSLAMLMASLGTSIANVALPTLALAFGASFQSVQWVVLAYLLAVTLLIVLVGRLGDLVGRRRLMLAGLALFAAASLLCALAPTLALLVAARAFQGLGAAVLLALTLTFVGELLPKEKTGSAMGLLGTMSAVGTALGPTLGGFLIASLGWQAIFLVHLPLGLATLALAYRHLPADRPSPASRPRLDLAVLLGERALSAGLATNLVVTMVVMATLVVGPFYLAGALALDAARVGLAMSAGPIVSALTGLPAGRLADRWGTRRVALGGLVAMAAGTLLMAALAPSCGVAGYLLSLVAITAGYASFQAANNTAAMAQLPTDRRGVVSGLLNLSRQLGLVAGTWILGAVFAWGAATGDLAAAPPEALAAGLRLTFGVATLLVALALAIVGRRFVE